MMRISKLLTLFILGVSFSNPSLCTESSEVVFKLMNYNVKGTPVFWYWHFRHKYIGKYLLNLKSKEQGASLISFQEMMHRKTSKIHKIAGYKYRDRGPKGRGLKISSGLEIVSDFEFIKKNQLKFIKCSGFDCLSKKGVQHVRVRVPNLPFPIDIYNTHLNAGQGRHHMTRYSQILELISFIKATRDPNIPIFIMGDFNFKQNDFEYEVLTKMIDLKNAAHSCGVLQFCDGEDDPFDIWKNYLIDHQFYSNGKSGKVTVTPIFYKHYFTNTKVGKFKKVPLSDHPGVVAHYRILYAE